MLFINNKNKDMRKLKYICILIWIVLSISIINAQKYQFNNLPEDNVKNNLDSIKKYEDNFRRIYDNLLTNFNNYQSNKPNYSNKILESILYDDILSKFYKNRFLRREFEYFNERQIKNIREYLNEEIQPCDDYYHELVSNYKLYSQIFFLQNHISDSLFYFIEKSLIDNGIVPSKYEFQLRNWSTLINLEKDQNLEDSLLNKIKNIYNKIKIDKKGNLRYFYNYIIPNTLFLINTKNSILKTLYLLDETSTNYDPFGDLEYRFAYFTYAILPKVKSSEFFIINSDDLQNDKKKEKIKEMILNDDSIWKDNIRLEK